MMPEAAPPYLVKVHSFNGKLDEIKGTGIFIARNLVLTCCHVVQKAGEDGQPVKEEPNPRDLVYADIEGRKAPTQAKVILHDPSDAVDLALLEVEEPLDQDTWIPGWKPVGTARESACPFAVLGWRTPNRRRSLRPRWSSESPRVR